MPVHAGHPHRRPERLPYRQRSIRTERHACRGVLCAACHAILGGTPHLQCGARHFFGEAPPFFSGMPHFFSGAPRLIDEAPHVAGGAPCIFGEASRCECHAPHVSGGTPCCRCGARPAFGGTPRCFGDTPRSTCAVRCRLGARPHLQRRMRLLFGETQCVQCGTRCVCGGAPDGAMKSASLLPRLLRWDWSHLGVGRATVILCRSAHGRPHVGRLRV